MKDFTLHAYREYLLALKKNNYPFLLFREFMPKQNQFDKYCLIRHDVDRKPQNALKMAQIENALDIKATYYFRIKSNVYKPDIIKQIEKLGHEIGYHYESLSDTNGNIEEALKDFENHLQAFRTIVQIDTVSMHGRPFKKFDNRDIWRTKENHDRLTQQYHILGEVYLDIDYTDMAYIGDTGRNWVSNESNMRDHVASNIKCEFNSGEDLLEYFKSSPHSKICFQIHPHRWSANPAEHFIQQGEDTAVNWIKAVIKKI